MTISKVLIANRGEIAVRIIRSAMDRGIKTVAVYTEDDLPALHCRLADEAYVLPGTGPAGYLDGNEIIRIAGRAGCDAVHPGYGFLSEDADFATGCNKAGLNFIGPSPETLALFGDKLRAVGLAQELDVPIVPGAGTPAQPVAARKLLEQSPNGIMIKALAGGGGRGMRRITSVEEIEPALERCRSEALRAFGNDALYIEQFLQNVRHIEVQLAGDGKGGIRHFFERDCSIQRRNQKLIEVCPAPNLDPALRGKIISAAAQLARRASLKSLATFEFLVPLDGPTAETPAFMFIEANPRLQVEHTITEEWLGVDLVALQFAIAAGLDLGEANGDTGAGLLPEPGFVETPAGYAVQLRVNAESYDEAGQVLAEDGIVRTFHPPAGRNVRVDTAAFAGRPVPPGFDSLLAKIIVNESGGSFNGVMRKASRILSETYLAGVQTNLNILRALVESVEQAYPLPTSYFDANLSALLKRGQELPVSAADFEGTALLGTGGGAAGDAMNGPSGSSVSHVEVPEGMELVTAPVGGRILSIETGAGAGISPGQELVIMDAMKMEHAVTAVHSGRVERILAEEGQVVSKGSPILVIAYSETGSAAKDIEAADPDYIRPDLEEVLRRKEAILDENRPQAAAKRKRRGQNTARQNVALVCDDGTFQEYGGLALAAQHNRRTLEELIKMSPADGLITGFGRVNGNQFPANLSRCAVLAYDYTVFAGTQGAVNHKKTDRILQLVHERAVPVILFAEGGGGRPGDVDVQAIAGLDLPTFERYASLRGIAPRIAVASGRCFAGNAALLGCSDVIIATENATIGMGGPVMIKGGGLGNFRAEDVGPVSVQAANGVIDIVVKNETAAAQTAGQALSYFQGDIQSFAAPEEKRLRHLIPENRLRAYDVHEVIRNLCDVDSVLELKKDYFLGMITAFARIGGRSFGLIANNPAVLAGAIDHGCAEKAAGFLELCNLFGIPIVSLCDTPGIMVGPEAEKPGLVKQAARLFTVGASLKVPFFTIVLRKGYGLGAMAMAGGSFHRSLFTIAWPTGEFGAMGLEGAVQIGHAKQLSEIKDWQEREKLFQELVAQAYERGKGLNMAAHVEIDDVIDPAETRTRLLAGLDSSGWAGPGWQ